MSLEGPLEFFDGANVRVSTEEVELDSSLEGEEGEGVEGCEGSGESWRDEGRRRLMWEEREGGKRGKERKQLTEKLDLVPKLHLGLWRSEGRSWSWGSRRRRTGLGWWESRLG